MVSKLLFPTKDKCKPIAKAVRDRLSIHDDSPLNSRAGRNNLEHIDERLADWAIAEGPGLLESVFDSRESLAFLDEHRWRIRRVLIMDEWTLLTTDAAGQRHETLLSSLSDALVSLLNEADQQSALVNYVGPN
jgi:hypothetical protein